MVNFRANPSIPILYFLAKEVLALNVLFLLKLLSYYHSGFMAHLPIPVRVLGQVEV